MALHDERGVQTFPTVRFSCLCEGRSAARQSRRKSRRTESLLSDGNPSKFLGGCQSVQCLHLPKDDSRGQPSKDTPLRGWRNRSTASRSRTEAARQCWPLRVSGQKTMQWGSGVTFLCQGARDHAVAVKTLEARRRQASRSKTETCSQTVIVASFPPWSKRAQALKLSRVLRVHSVKIETRAKGSVSDAGLASHCGPLATGTTSTRGRDVRMEGFMLVASVLHGFTSPSSGECAQSSPPQHRTC